MARECFITSEAKSTAIGWMADNKYTHHLHSESVVGGKWGVNWWRK